MRLYVKIIKGGIKEFDLPCGMPVSHININKTKVTTINGHLVLFFVFKPVSLLHFMGLSVFYDSCIS